MMFRIFFVISILIFTLNTYVVAKPLGDDTPTPTPNALGSVDATFQDNMYQLTNDGEGSEAISDEKGLQSAKLNGDPKLYEAEVNQVVFHEKIAASAKEFLTQINDPKKNITLSEGIKALSDAGYNEEAARKMLGMNAPEFEKSFSGAWKAIKAGKVISRIKNSVWGDKLKLTADQELSLKINLEATQKLAETAARVAKKRSALAEKVAKSGVDDNGGIGPSDEAEVVTNTDGPVSPDGAEHNNNGEPDHIDNQTDHDQSGDGHEEHEQPEEHEQHEQPEEDE